MSRKTLFLLISALIFVFTNGCYTQFGVLNEQMPKPDQTANDYASINDSNDSVEMVSSETEDLQPRVDTVIIRDDKYCVWERNYFGEWHLVCYNSYPHYSWNSYYNRPWWHYEYYDHHYGYSSWYYPNNHYNNSHWNGNNSTGSINTEGSEVKTIIEKRELTRPRPGKKNIVRPANKRVHTLSPTILEDSSKQPALISGKSAVKPKISKKIIVKRDVKKPIVKSRKNTGKSKLEKRGKILKDESPKDNTEDIQEKKQQNGSKVWPVTPKRKRR